MSLVYGPDGRVRRPVKKLYTLDKENSEKVSRKKPVENAPASHKTSEASCEDIESRQHAKRVQKKRIKETLPCSRKAESSNGAYAGLSASLPQESSWHVGQRGQEERIKETLLSSVKADGSNGAYTGLTAAPGTDNKETFGSRRICDARKALYASKITLTDDIDASATSAPAQRLVSQLKRLEVSGTAGNLVEPAPEACESRVSRKAPLSMSRGQQASSIVLAGDTPCPEEPAAAQARAVPGPGPGPGQAPRRRIRARAPTPPSVRRQNKERAPSDRQPPGGVSSFTFG